MWKVLYFYKHTYTHIILVYIYIYNSLFCCQSSCIDVIGINTYKDRTYLSVNKEKIKTKTFYTHTHIYTTFKEC